MQEYVKNALCIGGFADESAIDERLHNLRLSIALKLWNRVYGDHAVSINELPVWAIADHSFKAMSEGGEALYITIPKRPGKGSGVDCLITDDEWTTLFTEVNELRLFRDKFLREKKQYRSEVSTVLESVKTTKQLVELWPTAEEYIPAHMADPARGINLPILHISRLDEKLKGV